jgi:UDP-3-O-[3-hydroxymyristoyl] glucosamine N-acyltransferase
LTVADEERGVLLPAPVGVAELAHAHGGELDPGISSRTVRRLVSPDRAEAEDDLVVVTSPRWTARAGVAPGVLLCHAEVAARIAPGKRWVHAHAMYVVARLLGALERAPSGGVDPRAWVAPGADVDPTATVRAGAIIQSGARVGPRSIVGEGAVLYGGSRIGKGVVIGPLAVVGRPGFGWAEGPRGEVVRVPQLGGAVIEDDAEIGPLCTIDAGTLGPTVVGRGVKLDAHVHVAHNVTIGAGSFVAAQSGFAGSARIEQRVRIGGQVGVTDHATVGEGARIAAKSGVIGDVAPGAVVAGFPAVPKGAWLRAWARLLGVQRRTKT